MKRACANITAYIMVVVVIVTSVLSLPLSVSAQATTYDNGNNIIKVLDMALNKTGIVASPSTIQDFFDYMQDTVTSGAQVWSDMVDTAYNNVSSFVSACKDKVSDSSSGLSSTAGSLINGYLDYMGDCFDTVENFKAGYAKGENFRNYIMSYITDVEDNTLVGAINSKGNYKINSDLINLVRRNMDAFIEEHEGYWLVPSYTYKDILPSMFTSRDAYTTVRESFKTVPDDLVIYFNSNYFYSMEGSNAILNELSYITLENNNSLFNSLVFRFYVVNNNWSRIPFNYFRFYNGEIYDLSDSSLFSNKNSYFNGNVYKDIVCYSSISINPVFITSDARQIKIFKSLDAFKQYSVGKTNIYYSNTYSSFDNSVDNSITFTGQYYTTNAYSYTTIQNSIDNSQEINETTINNIVNNYITNNYYGTDNSGGGGSGGGGNDPGSSGNWFTDLITGIPKLLAALIDALSDLVSAGGELLEKIIRLFTDLFVPSEGFADPLIEKANEKFTFREQSEKNINLIFDQFSGMGQSIPTLTFPFSKTSLAKYGVGDYTVSFDWYAPYKPSVDVIFSAILWVMFAFNQYFAVKNIINASGSAVDIATRL